MIPSFIVPETEIRNSGVSEPIDLGLERADSLLITLGITRIVEQESLDVSIEGSENGNDWAVKPMVAFSQKFYCGSYQILLNLKAYPRARHLRARWSVNRWGKGDTKPLFGFYVFAQRPGFRTVAGSAA